MQRPHESICRVQTWLQVSVTCSDMAIYANKQLPLNNKQLPLLYALSQWAFCSYQYKFFERQVSLVFKGRTIATGGQLVQNTGFATLCHNGRFLPSCRWEKGGKRGLSRVCRNIEKLAYTKAEATR